MQKEWPKCKECGVEMQVDLLPGESATCWDCAVAEFPEMAALEEKVSAAFREGLKNHVWTDQGWRLKQ